MNNDTKSISIELWLFERTEEPLADEWGRCVVAASSESSARQLANEECGSEGYIWTDGHKVSGVLLGEAADGISGVQIFSRDMRD